MERRCRRWRGGVEEMETTLLVWTRSGASLVRSLFRLKTKASYVSLKPNGHFNCLLV